MKKTEKKESPKKTETKIKVKVKAATPEGAKAALKKLIK